MAIHDAIIGYNKHVDYMVEGMWGYIMSLRPIVKLPQQAPVKEWALISHQVTLKSEEELDKWRLGHFYKRATRFSYTKTNYITQVWTKMHHK
jgi:hypothetical protein